MAEHPSVPNPEQVLNDSVARIQNGLDGKNPSLVVGGLLTVFATPGIPGAKKRGTYGYVQEAMSTDPTLGDSIFQDLRLKIQTTGQNNPNGLKNIIGIAIGLDLTPDRLQTLIDEGATPKPPQREQYTMPVNSAREAVLAQIPDAEAREIMRLGIPADRLMPYSDRSDLWKDKRYDDWRNWSPQAKFLDLMQRQAAVNRPGQFYKDLFALTCAAQTPIELQNTFGALSAISSHSISNREYSQERATQAMIGEAQDAFLSTTITPQNIRAEVRQLSSELLSKLETGEVWGVDPNTTHSLFRKLFFNEFSINYTPNQNIPFLAETFLYFILNKDIPTKFRKRILNTIPFYQGFGRLSREEDTRITQPAFANGVSFFASADPSWIYPHLIHFQRWAFPDRSTLDIRALGEEYDKLRAEVAGLRLDTKQAQENLTQALRDKENLLRMIDRLNAMLESGGRMAGGKQIGVSPEQREAAGYYKEFGGHPLRVLGIDTPSWRNWTNEQRAAELLKAYRLKAKEFHPDVHSQSADDQVVNNLLNQSFTYVNKAYEFLKGNTSKAQFPDLDL